MLRIFRGDVERDGGSAMVRVQLAGQVRDQWVDEVRALCTDLLDHGYRVELRMADVSFVDTDGLRLLHGLVARGVALVNCALFVAEQLKTVHQAR